MKGNTKCGTIFLIIALLIQLMSGMTAAFGVESEGIAGEVQSDGSIWYKTNESNILCSLSLPDNRCKSSTANTIGGCRWTLQGDFGSSHWIALEIDVATAGSYEIKFGGLYNTTYGKIQINDGEQIDMQEVITRESQPKEGWDTAGTFELVQGKNTVKLYYSNTKNSALRLDTVSIKAVQEQTASPELSPSPVESSSPELSPSPDESPSPENSPEQIFTFWGNEDKLTATKEINPDVSWSSSVQNNYVYPNNKRDNDVKSTAEKYYVLYQEKATRQTLQAQIPVNEPGIYDVYFLNPLTSSGNDSAVQITINNTNPVVFDMTQGGWHKISTYQLDDTMSFKAQMTEFPKNMRFDSIKLVPAGPDASPEPTVQPDASPSPVVSPSPEEGVYYIDDGDADRFQLVYDSSKGTEVSTSNRNGTSYNGMHTYCSVPGAYGTFTLSGIPSGIYEIYYYFPLQWEQNAREALITVDDRNGGTFSSTYNMEEIESATWEKIGDTFTIIAENPGYVRAKNPDSPDGRSVIRFDAVKLVKVGDVQVPPVAKDVSISGSLKPDSVLNGSYRYVSDSGFIEGETVKKWYRSDRNDQTAVWTEIGEGDSYTLNEQDVNQFIKFEVTPKAVTDQTDLQVGTPSSCILGPVPEGEVVPEAKNIKIQGKTSIFMTLTASYEYSDANLDTEEGSVYQWYIGDTNENVTTKIANASGVAKQGDQITYTLKTEDIGKYIRLGVTPKNNAGTGVEVFSDIKGPVENISSDTIPYANHPVIIGTGAEGYSVSVGYEYEHPYGFAEGNTVFQWYVSDSRNGEYTPISGATSNSYEITEGQFGKYIKASVTPVTLEGNIVGTTVTTEPIAVKWKMAWSDEFNYTAADGLDPAFTQTWTAESNAQIGRLLGGRWPENVEVSDGSLKLKQKKEVPQKGGQDWSSASVGTKKMDFGYGRYEARYKYAAATGINNGFWLTSPDWGKEGFYEIDVNEGHYPNEVNTNLHFYGGSASQNYQVPGVVDLAQEYHTYTFDWSEDELVFAIDGVVIRRMENTACKTDTYTAQLLFSTAIMDWSGDVTDAIDGTVMEVDYIRYFQHDLGFVDTEPLEEAIDKANRTLHTSKAGTTVACYAENKFAPLQTAVDTAQAILDNGFTLTSTEVKEAADNLNKALESFYNGFVYYGSVTSNNSPVYIPEFFNHAVTIHQNTLSRDSLEIKLLANKPLANTLTIEYPYNRTSNVTITIPQGTYFGGSTDADGYVTLKLPNANTELPVSVPGTMEHVLDMGDLTVGSRAIRIQISDQASMDLGYVRDGDFIKVTDTISTGVMEEALLLVDANTMIRNNIGDNSLDIWSRIITPIVVYEENGTDEPPTTRPPITGGGDHQYHPSAEPSEVPEPSPSASSDPNPSPVNFKDIEGHWAENEITELAEQGIIKGVTEEEYMPERSISRAEFTALIVRTLGLETVEYNNEFKDVTTGDWYADEVQTAVENGIISRDEHFRPNDTITREEMTKVMVEALESATGEETEIGEVSQFQDAEEISGWAREYVAKGVQAGLVKGISEEEFSPKSEATRAQGAVMIYRLLGMIELRYN